MRIVTERNQMANLPHAAAKCAELQPIIITGLTYMTCLIWSASSLVLGIILGWYAKGRGLQGIRYDLNNTKNEIEKLKAKFNEGTNISTSTDAITITPSK